jgi:misacylated tRNA(Ala) deacylase
MTVPLYLTSADARTFEATVERVADDRVVLDRTCFYPTGGGQPNDVGTLAADGAEWRVTDVRKKDAIYHTLDLGSAGSTDADDSTDTDALADPPAEGATVTGRIDWDRRRAHSRYHTAQHLLSALLLEEYDAETTGNQLYADRARLDCAYPRFDEDDLADIERRMNELVEAELPVRWYELDRAEAEATLDPERTRLHLLPESITEVRIVEIGDEAAPYDQTACAGTHIANTRDVGAVQVTGRATRGGDEERLYFELDGE